MFKKHCPNNSKSFPSDEIIYLSAIAVWNTGQKPKGKQTEIYPVNKAGVSEPLLKLEELQRGELQVFPAPKFIDPYVKFSLSTLKKKNKTNKPQN